MESVSHRELRNNSGRVLQAVAAGEAYTVTNNGRPVARLIPVTDSRADLRCTRPASKHGGFGELERHRIEESVYDALEDLRGDR